MNTKHYLNLFFFLCLGTTLLAQEEPFTVLYINTNQGVNYRLNDKAELLFAGKTLPAYGKLVVNADAYITLIYEGRKTKLEGPKTYDLTDIAHDIKLQPESTFLNRFWNFLSNSVRQSRSKQDLENYYKEVLANTTAGIRGFGDKEYALIAPQYLQGTVAESAMTMTWTPGTAITPYYLRIEKRENQTLVYEKKVWKTYATVNLEALGLEPGAVYKWSVTTQGTDAEQLTTPNYLFRYAPEEVDGFFQSVRESRLYQQLTPEEQPLYLLQRLEEEGFFNPAYTLYLEKIEEAPDHQIYQRLFAAFLVRMNDLEAAKEHIRS